MTKTLFGFDRRACVAARTCPPAPIGCGQPWGEFRDAASVKESQITGFCQACQDKIFAEEP